MFNCPLLLVNLFTLGFQMNSHYIQPDVICYGSFYKKQKLYEGGPLLPYLGQLPSNFIEVCPFG